MIDECTDCRQVPPPGACWVRSEWWAGYLCPACDHQRQLEWYERRLLDSEWQARDARRCGQDELAGAFENSVRYFARRIEQLTGEQLTDPAP